MPPGDIEEDIIVRGGVIYMKNQSNSTVAPFEHMMHRHTNIQCSFKMTERWNGNWGKFAKCGVTETMNNNGRR